MAWVWIETFEEFVQRMECDYVCLPSGSYLFANGAMSDGKQQHTEPAEDRGAQLSAQHKFWTIRYDQADREAKNRERFIAGQTAIAASGHGVDVEDFVFEQLREYQQQASYARQQCDEIERQLHAAQGETPVQRAARDQQENHSRARKAMERLSSIMSG